MTIEDDMIREACNKLDQDTSPELRKAATGVAENVLKKGMIPRDAMGIKPDFIESLYGHAYRLYNAGKYADAQKLFGLLIVLDPLQGKFILGSAACYHMEKAYANAAATYAMVSMAEPMSPIPHYHASDCLIKMNLLGAAESELRTTVQLCGENPAYAMIRSRSQMMIERLQSGQPLNEESTHPSVGPNGRAGEGPPEV